MRTHGVESNDSKTYPPGSLMLTKPFSKRAEYHNLENSSLVHVIDVARLDDGDDDIRLMMGDKPALVDMCKNLWDVAIEFKHGRVTLSAVGSRCGERRSRIVAVQCILPRKPCKSVQRGQ